MLVRFAVVLALQGMATQGFAKAPPPTAAVGGTRQVVLDEKTVGKTMAIRTARNLLTTVEFPEDMLGAPTCGDCTDGRRWRRATASAAPSRGAASTSNAG